MDFIDYSYYKDTYCGVLAEEEFCRVHPKAAAYLRGATRGRIKTADTDVCFLLCELCDIFSEENAHRGVSSENCDGYSVSYRAETDGTDEAWETVKLYLEHRGLLYGGVL